MSDGASPTKPKLIVRALRETDCAALAEFYRKVWDATATADSVLAAIRRSDAENVAHTGAPLPTAVVSRGDEIVGYCGSIRQPMHLRDQRVEAYWAKGLMVLPEYRSGVIGYQVLKALTEMLPCGAAVTVAPASKRLFRSLNYVDYGPVPNFVRPLRFDRMLAMLDTEAVSSGRLPARVVSLINLMQRTGLARAVGLLARGADHCISWIRHRVAGQACDVRVAHPSVEELEAIWQRSSPTIAACPERSGLAQHLRYLQGKDAGRYSHVIASDRSGPLGWACMRAPDPDSVDPRLAGLSVVAASDFLYPADRPEVGLALALAVERRARQLDADVILGTASHSSLQSALRRALWIRLEGNIHFLLRDTGSHDWPAQLDAWWITRGDGFSDSTF